MIRINPACIVKRVGTAVYIYDCQEASLFKLKGATAQVIWQLSQNQGGSQFKVDVDVLNPLIERGWIRADKSDASSQLFILPEGILQVEGSDSTTISMISRSLSMLVPNGDITVTDGTSVASMSINASLEPPELPLAARKVKASMGLTFYELGNLLFVKDDVSVWCLNHEHLSVEGKILSGNTSLLGLTFAEVLSSMLVRRTGGVDVHGALLDTDQAPILILGPSNIGKSTLAIAACEQFGWSLITDETAYYIPTGIWNGYGPYTLLYDPKGNRNEYGTMRKEMANPTCLRKVREEGLIVIALERLAGGQPRFETLEGDQAVRTLLKNTMQPPKQAFTVSETKMQRQRRFDLNFMLARKRCVQLWLSPDLGANLDALYRIHSLHGEKVS